MFAYEQQTYINFIKRGYSLNLYTTINDQVFESFPLLESERLVLRSFNPQDAQAFFLLRAHPQVMTYLDTDPLRSLEEATLKIEQIHANFKHKEGINWAITERESNDMIGYCGIWRLDQKNCRGEIGYALHPAYWGKGYMTETLHLILDFAFERFHLHSIEANTNPENQASKDLLTRLGFQQEAYFRENYLYNDQFIDSAIFCLLASDREVKNQAL
jgi:ribosomal-protein-alanine N-acetyltransferase